MVVVVVVAMVRGKDNTHVKECSDNVSVVGKPWKT